VVLVLITSTTTAQGRVWIADDAPPENGAIWTLALDPSGSLASQKEISSLAGTFPERLRDLDEFGASVALLGDLNGDGIADLAVGAPGDDGGGAERGCVWILFRSGDAGVSSVQPIRAGEGGWTAALRDGDRFGSALAQVGDLNRDGIPELAVGAPGNGGGSVWILSLNAKGLVRSALRIGASAGGFQGALDAGDRFGSSLALLGDADADGRPELAVGAPGDDDGSLEGGALYILSLKADGVHAQRKISSTSGGFGGASISEELGSSVALVGDIDGDGTGDIALGGPRSDLGGTDKGALWILFLRPDGTVRGQQEIGMSTGGAGSFPNEHFGASVAALGDLNGDSIPDLAVGAPLVFSGEVFLLFLDTDGTCKTFKNVNRPRGRQTNGRLGSSLASLGDLNRDGRPDIAVGATGNKGPFMTLLAALDAASDGDVVLVQGGTYPELSLGTKSLTVLADRDAIVSLGPSTITSLVGSMRVELRGLRFSPSSRFPFGPDFFPGLKAVNNEGLVWIEDCEVIGSEFEPSGPGMLLDGSTEVVLIETRVKGTSPGVNGAYYESTQSGHGLVLRRGSEVVAYDSEFRGANGYSVLGEGDFPRVTQGGSGILSASSTDRLFLSDVEAIGGNGDWTGNGFDPTCSFGGAGLSTAGVARVLDSRLRGGLGGASPEPCAPNGPDRTGSVRPLQGQSLRFSVNSPVREGEPVQLDFHGPPLSPVWLFSSPDPTSIFVPVLRGELLIDTPAIKLVGSTDASGALHLTRTQPELPQGVESTTTFLQALYLEPGSSGAGRTGRYVLGAGTMLVALDQSF